MEVRNDDLVGEQTPGLKDALLQDGEAGARKAVECRRDPCKILLESVEEAPVQLEEPTCPLGGRLGSGRLEILRHVGGREFPKFPLIAIEEVIREDDFPDRVLQKAEGRREAGESGRPRWRLRLRRRRRWWFVDGGLRGYGPGSTLVPRRRGGRGTDGCHDSGSFRNASSRLIRGRRGWGFRARQGGHARGNRRPEHMGRSFPALGHANRPGLSFKTEHWPPWTALGGIPADRNTAG